MIKPIISIIFISSPEEIYSFYFTSPLSKFQHVPLIPSDFSSTNLEPPYHFNFPPIMLAVINVARKLYIFCANEHNSVSENAQR